MKKIIWILLLSIIPVFAQNLIMNPGFEDGFNGWGNLWLRDAGQGEIELSTDTKQSGDQAVHITHWGEQDWAFEQNQILNPGDYYEIGCWFMAPELDGWSGISVITYNSDGSVIDWTYGEAGFYQSNEFVNIKKELQIPDGVEKIKVRFTGGGSGDIYIDDVSCEKREHQSEETTVTIENDNFQLAVQIPEFIMTVLDKRSGQTYTSVSAPGFIVNNILESSNEVTFESRYLPLGADFNIIFLLNDNGFSGIVKGDPNQPFTGSISFPGAFTTTSSDYFLVPTAAGIIIPATEPYPFWGNFNMWDWKATMAFVGLTNMESGYLYISNDPWDTAVQFAKNSGTKTYQIQPHLHASKGKLGYNRSFKFVFADKGGYVSLAKLYRAHADSCGYIKTFEEKQNDNPNMQKLQGAVNLCFWVIRIRMTW